MDGWMDDLSATQESQECRRKEKCAKEKCKKGKGADGQHFWGTFILAALIWE